MTIENVIEYLKPIAARGIWTDNEDEQFCVVDYSGDNVDDAYDGGRRCGEVELARKLLAKIAGQTV